MSDEILSELVRRGIVAQEQTRPLVEFLRSIRPPESETRFTLVHVCWYLGAAGSLIAFALFADQIKDSFGYGGFGVVLSVEAVAAVAAAVIVTAHLEYRSVLAGLLSVVGILCAGAAILSFQAEADLLVFPIPDAGDPLLNFGDHLAGTALSAVLFVTVASLIGLSVLRFIPLTVLVTLGCWYIAYDRTLPDGRISMGLFLCTVGMVTTLIGWFSDVKAHANYGYWLNKLGMWVVPIGLLAVFERSAESGMFVFAILNVALILLALYLRRPGGVIGGAGGLMYYLHHLYDEYFRHSLAFPFVIIVAGGVLMYFGWRLYRARTPLDEYLPEVLRGLRPHERGDPVVFGA